MEAAAQVAPFVFPSSSLPPEVPSPGHHKARSKTPSSSAAKAIRVPCQSDVRSTAGLACLAATAPSSSLPKHAQSASLTRAPLRSSRSPTGAACRFAGLWKLECCLLQKELMLAGFEDRPWALSIPVKLPFSCHVVQRAIFDTNSPSHGARFLHAQPAQQPVTFALVACACLPDLD